MFSFIDLTNPNGYFTTHRVCVHMCRGASIKIEKVNTAAYSQVTSMHELNKHVA